MGKQSRLDAFFSSAAAVGGTTAVEAGHDNEYSSNKRLKKTKLNSKDLNEYVASENIHSTLDDGSDYNALNSEDPEDPIVDDNDNNDNACLIEDKVVVIDKSRNILYALRSRKLGRAFKQLHHIDLSKKTSTIPSKPVSSIAPSTVSNCRNMNDCVVKSRLGICKSLTLSLSSTVRSP